MVLCATVAGKNPRAAKSSSERNPSEKQLRILTVAFPFAPLGPDAVGGAEQIASALDSGLCLAGHQSTVLSTDDSQVFGNHVSPGFKASLFSTDQKQSIWEKYKNAIMSLLASDNLDLVHMHGIDFHHYLPDTNRAPILVTLHLPIPWYPAEIFSTHFRQDVWFQCVSDSQRKTCPPSPRLLPVIQNGVPAFECCSGRKQNFALLLGRICPEKGYDLALDAIREAAVPAVLAGSVFPYETHIRHFREKIVPRLGQRAHYIGPVGGIRKRNLLCQARCVVVPSLAPETSSLTAMEAAMAGTPVVAFPSGALSEIVEDGKTGFLVSNLSEMAEAIRRAHHIDGRECHARAMARFNASRMLNEYLRTYRNLISTWKSRT